MSNSINSSYFIQFDESGNKVVYFSVWIDINAAHNANIAVANLLLSLSVILALESVSALAVFVAVKKLRTVTNLFIVCNTFGFLLLVPFGVFMHLAAEDGQWLLGTGACKYGVFSTLTTSFISMWIMAAIAIDRHRQITTPALAQLSLPSACLVMFLISVAGTIIMSPYIYIYVTMEVRIGEELFTICTRPASKITTILPPLAILFGFVIPLVIQSVCYTRILREIYKTNAKMTKRKIASVAPAVTAVAQKPPADDKRNKRYRNVVMTLVIILVVYILMWLPLCFLFVGMFFDEKKETYKLNSVHIVAGKCLVVFNACITPMIYALSDNNTRRVLFQHCIGKK